MKTLNTNQVLELNDAVNILFEEEIKFPINTAYKLFKLKNNLNEISDYIINRIVELIPKLKEENPELTEEETIIYQTILNSPIEIETYNLEREQLYCLYQQNEPQTPLITPSLIEKLEPLF